MTFLDMVREHRLELLAKIQELQEYVAACDVLIGHEVPTQTPSVITAPKSTKIPTTRTKVGTVWENVIVGESLNDQSGGHGPLQGRTCDNPKCRKTYDAAAPRQRYCSPECKAMCRPIVELNARVCKNPACVIQFVPSSKIQKYCTPRCMFSAQNDRARAKLHQHEREKIHGWPEEEQDKFLRWATTYAAGSYVNSARWPEVVEFVEKSVITICHENVCQRGVSAATYVGDIFITRLKAFVQKLGVGTTPLRNETAQVSG